MDTLTDALADRAATRSRVLRSGYHSAQAPLLSVLVITYQQEEYIGRCLEGVLKQQVDFSYEVIIGTDCSTDRTDEIVLEYFAKYPSIIKPVFRPRNIGALANARSVLEKARGKYVATCDGDDEWTDPEKLKKQVRILESQPDTVLVYTDVDQYYVGSRRRIPSIQRRLKRRSAFPDRNSWFEAILLGKAIVHTATICVRTDSFRNASKDVSEILDRSPMGDTPMLLALTQYGQFVYLSESTALMNRLPESASRSRCPLRRAEFYLASISMQMSIARTYCYSSREFKKLLARRALMLLRLSILGRSPSMATRVMRTLSKDVPLNSLHRLLHALARCSWASVIFQQSDAAAISVRRVWRRLRYGVESSI